MSCCEHGSLESFRQFVDALRSTLELSEGGCLGLRLSKVSGGQFVSESIDFEPQRFLVRSMVGVGSIDLDANPIELCGERKPVDVAQ